jgi:hypothetical protein
MFWVDTVLWPVLAAVALPPPLLPQAATATAAAISIPPNKSLFMLFMV